MSKETFTRVLGELPSNSNINLHHRGEPTLHPQIAAMAGALTTRGHSVRMHTNGTRLDKVLRGKLIESGLPLLSISFDGPDRERFERLRTGARYDQVVANLRSVLKERKGSNLKVQVELIAFDDLGPRPTLISSVQQRVAPEQFDRVVIRKAHNWDGTLGPIRQKTENSDQRSENQKPPIGNPTANSHQPTAPLSVSSHPCPHLWSTLAVLADGTVTPCAQDYAGKLNLGDIHTQSLAEIWNGSRMRELRHLHSKGRINEIDPCASCEVPRREGSEHPWGRLTTWRNERALCAAKEKSIEALPARARLSLASPKKAAKIDALREALPPLGRWLEIGSGAGVLSWALRDGREWTYLGEDPDLRRFAESLLGQTPIALADLETLPAHRFDGVLLSDHLEHVLDDAKFVRSCARVLKPGGVLLVTVPSANRKLYALRRGLGLRDEDLGHVREGYSPDTLAALLKDEGLEVGNHREFCGPLTETVEALMNALHRAAKGGNGRPDFNPEMKASKSDLTLSLIKWPLKAILRIDSLLANPKSGYGLLMLARKKRSTTPAVLPEVQAICAETNLGVAVDKNERKDVPVSR